MTSTISSASGFCAMRCATATPPSVWCTRCGSRSPAGSRTTSPNPASGCISRCTPPSSGRRASRWRCRSAPRTCTRPPSTASPRTGVTKKPRAATEFRRATPPPRSTTWRGCDSCSTGSGKRPTRASSSSRCGTTSRCRRSSCSPRRAMSSRCPPGPRPSTSPTRCTPRWGTAVSGHASTAGSSRWSANSKTAKWSRFSRRRQPTRARRGTGRRSWCRRGPRPRSGSGSPRSVAKRRWSQARMRSRARCAAVDFRCSA